jgi:hypothetical protein
LARSGENALTMPLYFGSGTCATCSYRLGAKVHATNGVTTWLPLPWHATNVIASLPLRWYLSKTGYDLVKAGGGLIGLSNSMGDDPSDFHRATYTNSIQVGLNLPRDRNDESMRLLKETWDRRHGVAG